LHNCKPGNGEPGRAGTLARPVPQTLRRCERRGLLWPAGTSGGTHWYSRHNRDRLRRIAELLQDGLNLTGIALVLDREHTNAQLRTRPGEHPNSPAPTA